MLREAWAMYKVHWRHLVPAVFVLLALFTLLLVTLLGWVGVFASVFIAFAGIFWLQGALVIAVQDVRDGRADLSIRETLSRVRRRMNTLGLAGFAAAIGIGVATLFLIVPGLVLATWWVFIVPVIVLEGAGVLAVFGRSREPVRGNGWNVFGLIVLTFLILIVAGIAIALVLSPLPDGVQRYVGDVVSNTLLAPFVALAFTLAYFRLRDARAEAVAGASDVSPAGEASTFRA